MTPKHTPGPWINDYMPSTGFGCGYGKSQIVAAKGQAIAAVAAVEPEDGPMYRDGTLSEETLVALEANARLIAAAPELLDELESAIERAQQVLVDLESGDIEGIKLAAQALIAEARTAISKATEGK